MKFISKIKTFPALLLNAACKTPRRTEACILAAYGLTTMAIALWGIFVFPTVPGQEAFHRAMSATDLLNGLSRGREALVGSAGMAPRPTIILTIAASLPLLEATRTLFILITAASAFILAWHANGLWRSKGLHPAFRFVGGIALLTLPPIALSIRSGQSTIIFVSMAVGAMAFLLDWLAENRLRSLAYAGVLMGLATGVRYEGLLLALGASLIICTAVLYKKMKAGGLEGTLLIFITPICYILLLWIGGNWLILGSPFFLLKGPVRALKLELFEMSDFFRGTGEWQILALAAAIVILPFASGLIFKGEKFSRLKNGTLAIAVVTACIVSIVTYSQPGPATTGTEKEALVAELEHRYDNASFIITGYRGYDFTQLAGEDEETVWVHLMHLEQTRLDEILADFKGRDLYLLLHNDDLTAGWMDLGIVWIEPWTNIPEQFHFSEKLNDWVIFEVLRRENPAG